MQGLQVWNDQLVLSISRDGRFEYQVKGSENPCGGFGLQEGSVELAEAAPATGILYYAMPCVFERLMIRTEEQPVPLLNQMRGEWPVAVEEDELETYPYLHFLEERKTGTPWRLERWYTVAGPYLVFDSEQYFERSRPRQRGRNWERLIVQLRQVADLPHCSQNPAPDAVNLVSRVET